MFLPKDRYKIDQHFRLGAIHLGRPTKIGIFRPPLPRLSGLNNRIPLKITIEVRFSKTPPPPGKPDVLNGWPLINFKPLDFFPIFFAPLKFF